MQSWNTRFGALEIKHLRSPAFAHPMAFEPTALVHFAIREGRTSELMEAPVSTAWLASTDVGQDALLKSLPSTALFTDFCASLEATLPHEWLSGAATCVSKDASTGELRVAFRPTGDQRERTVAARAVILATGPVGRWNIPAPFEVHFDSPRILHTEELLGESKGTLSEEIMRRCPSESARVLVIGGGHPSQPLPNSRPSSRHSRRLPSSHAPYQPAPPASRSPLEYDAAGELTAAAQTRSPSG